MFNFNSDQVQSFLRSLLKMGGGFLLSRGLVTDTAWADISGGILALIGLLWSHFYHADTSAPPSGPNPAVKLMGILAITVTVVVGCQSLDRNVYNGMNLTTDTVAGGRHTFNVWLQMELASAQERGDSNRVESLLSLRDYVHEQVYHFAIAESVLNQIRIEYKKDSSKTNATALLIGLDTLTGQGSNIVWGINYFMKGGAVPVIVTRNPQPPAN